MFRRRGRLGLISTSAVTAVLLLLPAWSAGGAADPVISARIGAAQTGSAMPPGFIGLSLEYRALHVYAGRDPLAVNPVFVQLLRSLTPGQAPVLRIGGDSTDQTWWPIGGSIPPGGITYNLTKGWLRVTHALAAQLGAKLVLGVNLAAGRPALAAEEARALLQGIGRRYIDALEIGNEADVYNQFPWYRDRSGRNVYARPHSYNLSRFISDFSRWRAALPHAPIAGPTFASLTWMDDLQSFLAAEPNLALVTFHRYPLRGCVRNVNSPDYASIPNLLSDMSSSSLAANVAQFASLAHAAGAPFRLDELNSAACTGRRGVSNTFAAALWVLDTLFNLANVGVDGVNIHTLPGAPYEPFSFTHKHGHWSAFVHPLYYGLLMFAQAFPRGARMLPVSAPSGPVKIWATQAQAPDGHLRVLIINKDPDTEVDVHLQLPGSQSTLASEWLRAPSLSSTSGVTLGGSSFGTATESGSLPQAPSPSRVSPFLGYYSITVPAGSAVLLTR